MTVLRHNLCKRKIYIVDDGRLLIIIDRVGQMCSNVTQKLSSSFIIFIKPNSTYYTIEGGLSDPPNYIYILWINIRVNVAISVYVSVFLSVILSVRPYETSQIL